MGTTTGKTDSEATSGQEGEQEKTEAIDRRNGSMAPKNSDATDAQENYKFWDRMGQVLDDESISDPGVVTTLIILARLMGEDDEVAISLTDLAPKARVSRRTLHDKLRKAEELGYIERDTKGHEGDTNLYRAKGSWAV